MPTSIRSTSAARAPIWILADTDTVFQCTPDELYERFTALGAPLVIGTEHCACARIEPAALLTGCHCGCRAAFGCS